MTKLVGLAMVGTVIVGITAGVLLIFLGQANLAYTEAVTRLQPANQHAAGLDATIHQLSAAARGYILMPSPELEQQFDEARDEFGTHVEAIRALSDDEQLAAQLDQVDEVGARYIGVFEQMIQHANRNERFAATELMRSEAVTVNDELTAITGQLKTRLGELADAAVLRAEQRARLARVITAIATPLGFLLALLIGIRNARVLNASVRRIAETALQVAEGNLQVDEIPATEQDEVGDTARAVNQMVTSLRSLIHEVRTSAADILDSSTTLGEVSEQAGAAAAQVASAMQHLAAGGTSQAESASAVQGVMADLQEAIRQVAAGAETTTREIHQAGQALHDVVAETEQMAERASHEADVVGQGAQSASDGARAVQATTTGMLRVQEAVNRSAEQIDKLAQLLKQIGTITTAIADIAGQTNLLALNAAIEAARAGEHGRGFAVVADEVRHLAEGASNSAREIDNLVASIQAGADSVVEAMEAGLREVEAGVRQAGEANQILTQLQAASEASAQSVQEIAAAAAGASQRLQSMTQLFDSIVAVAEQNSATAEQMSAGAVEVRQSLDSVTSIAQDNAAATEEVSASVEEVAASGEEVSSSAARLREIAQQLEAQVARFRC